MNAANLVRLIVLSAIWGASFLFMRVAVPAMGPGLLIFLRVAFGALFLAGVAIHLAKALDGRQNWRHFLVLGFFNSALPFWLYAFAAQTVSASLLSILNSTAPIWAAVIGAVWTRTPLSRRSLVGLLLGVIGVATLAGGEALALPRGGLLAIAAGLGAAACYGIATVYAKSAKAVEPFANAHGTMWAATLLMLPLAVTAPLPAAWPEFTVAASVVALGVVCSGVAFLLYFRLIADIGPTSALTVAFLIPVFGVLWGALFLDEAVGWHTLLGSAVVLTGTALVTGFSLRAAVLGRRH